MTKATEQGFVYTSCMGAGCHEQCFVKTFTEDGKVSRTERAIITEPEGDRFGICQKGIIYPKVPYLPERLLYPMKRTGPRGSGQYQRISWDQAMDEIGSKLRQIRDESGPEAICVSVSTSGYPNNTTPCLHIALQYGFLFGTGFTGLSSGGYDNSSFMSQGIDFGSTLSFQLSDSRLLREANFVIIWAGSPIGNTRMSTTTRCLLDAQESGARLIHIDVRYSPTSAKSDQFISINSGTDAAMALAMSNILITENRYDSSFLRNHTVAPYLVRLDTGKFLRGSDIEAEGNPDHYVVWGASPASIAGTRAVPAPEVPGAVVVAPHTHDYGTLVADLNAEVELNGIACATAFVLLKKHIAQYTPAWQEEITGVSEQVVRGLVDEYMEKKGLIVLEEGIRYTNGINAYRAIHLFAALSGFLRIPGAGLDIIGSGNSHPTTVGVLNDMPIMFPRGIEAANVGLLRPDEVIKEFTKPETKYRAAIFSCGNNVHAYTGREFFEKDFFPKLDLTVVFDVQMSETAYLSDYVLPDTTTFEKYDLIVNANHVILQEPAIEPLGEVKSPAEFWYLLADQLGLGDSFNKTDEEWCEFRLNSQHPALTSVEPPVTLERLKKEKFVRLNAPTDNADPFLTGDFMTPSGQMGFYNEDLVDADSAFAKWEPPFIHTPKRAQFPFQMLAARNRFLMQSALWHSTPELMELVGWEPEIFINPADAEKLNVHDGELVEVFNERGAIKIKARYSQVVAPGAMQVWYSYTDDKYVAGGIRRIGQLNGDPEMIDDLCRVHRKANDERWAIPEGVTPSWELLMAGKSPRVLNWETHVSGCHDTIWENTCDIRKIKEAK